MGPASTTFTLETIEVTACQYGGIYPDCKSPAPSGGTVGPTSPSAPSGPSGGPASSGGGSSTIPPDTAKRAACKTGNDIIDSPAVQAAFRQIWLNSNPAATNTWDRREQGGWIVPSGNGYTFQSFTDMSSYACSMSPGDDYAPMPPSNAVAWVHTHPFAYGEFQESCKLFDTIVKGLVVTPTYLGTPSIDDIVMGNRINSRLAAMGKAPIQGIMIDNEGIKRFLPAQQMTGDSTVAIPLGTGIQRCGY
jgi:hypothetical protein